MQDVGTRGEPSIDALVALAPDLVVATTDLPANVVEQIEHFFAHYKDLEPGKWVKVHGWQGPEVAERLILEGIERAKAAGLGEPPQAREQK